jgi:hypothetical protein
VRRRHLIGVRYHHFEGALIHRFAHEVVVERSLPFRGVGCPNIFADLGRTAEIDLVSTLLPKQKFHDALYIL